MCIIKLKHIYTYCAFLHIYTYVYVGLDPRTLELQFIEYNSLSILINIYISIYIYVYIYMHIYNKHISPPLRIYTYI
jgi:hypothetical protein